MSLSGKTIVAGSPAEEQEEAPAAKKATRDDEQICVRARGGEEVTMPREVARLAGHLKDLMDDASSEDGVYPVPIVTASTLRALVCMPEIARSVPGVHRVEQFQNKSFEELRYEGYASNPLSPSSDEHSLSQLMEHVEGALFLDAPMLLKHNQFVIASRVNGKNADELRALLGAGSDFDGAELEAALAESAFLPEGYEAPQQLGAASSTAPLAPLRQPSLSGVPATTDAREAALGMVDVATLCELKGVNRFWRALSRRVLCSRLCRGRGQPAPTHLEEITDLDVELLIEAGRPGDTALAGRMLPGLARLHGYGFVVDVAKVRAATLDDEDDEDDDENNDEGQEGSLLRGTAKAALDSCISGDGEAPLKLKIAAVACAGTGVVCGVPVQHMREDTMTELDLREKGLCGPVAMLISYLIPVMGGLTKISLARNNLEEEGTKAICEALEQNTTLKELDISGHREDSNIGGSAGAKHVAKMVRVNGALTVTNLLHNQLDEASAKMLAEVAKQKGISLCGIQRDQTTADLSGHALQPPDAILLASDLSQAVVTGGLTKLSLAKNKLGEEGTKFLCDALVGNNTLKELDLSGDTSLRDTVSNIGGTAGAKHVANMLLVNGALTRVNVRHNSIAGDGAARLAAAVLGNLKIEMFNEIPIKEMRANSFTELDLKGKVVGVEGGMVVAGLMPVMGALTKIDVSWNIFGPEDAKVFADALRVNGALTSLDLSNNALCGVTSRGGTYTAEGITAIADALRVNGGLTSIDVRRNKIAGDGAVQLAAAVLGNLKIEIFNKIPIKEMRANSLTELDLKGKYVGVEGGMVVAGLIPVMGALTVTNLLGNQLDAESAKMLTEVAKQKGISLCGIQRDQTTADFSNQNLKPPDAILLASDLLQADVTGGLTKMSLAKNELGEEGTKAICEALEQNKTLKELDISGAKYKNNIGWSAGAKHVAKMLGANGGLTKVPAF